MPTDDPAALVRQALEHLHNQPYLEAHPLARLLGDGSRSLSGAAVRRRLLETIEEVRPSRSTPAAAVDWRRYRHLALRYVEGQGLDRVLRELAVSPRQASRDYHEAIGSIVTLLRLRPPDAAEAARPLAGDGDATPDEPPATDLAEVVRGAVATLKKLLPDRARRIDVSLSDTLPPVALDRSLLRQALLHLLISAATAKPGARLALSGSDTARGVTVRLRSAARGEEASGDDGAAGCATTSGLTDAARQILASTGGLVEVEGNPRCPDGYTVVVPPARLRTLLVVDDNPDVAGLYRRYLRGEACRTLQATTGAGALKVARQLRPDLIVLDVLLPGEDGWELLAALRRAADLQRTPVVVSSVLPERALAQSLGVAGFLPKPVGRPALIAAMERWCPARRANRALPATTA